MGVNFKRDGNGLVSNSPLMRDAEETVEAAINATAESSPAELNAVETNQSVPTQDVVIPQVSSKPAAKKTGKKKRMAIEDKEMTVQFKVPFSIYMKLDYLKRAHSDYGNTLSAVVCQILEEYFDED